MLLLLTIFLVLVGAVMLIIGFIQDSLVPIYISIGCSVAAAAVLVAFSRISRRQGVRVVSLPREELTPEAPTPAAAGGLVSESITVLGPTAAEAEPVTEEVGPPRAAVLVGATHGGDDDLAGPEGRAESEAEAPVASAATGRLAQAEAGAVSEAAPLAAGAARGTRKAATTRATGAKKTAVRKAATKATAAKKTATKATAAKKAATKTTAVKKAAATATSSSRSTAAKAGAAKKTATRTTAAKKAATKTTGTSRAGSTKKAASKTTARKSPGTGTRGS